MIHARTIAAGLALALILSGCQGFRGGVERVDAVSTVESWGPHHLRTAVGPKATWAGGASLFAYGGYQTDVYWPGEPHFSDRAPRDAAQGGVECSFPLWTRP